MHCHSSSRGRLFKRIQFKTCKNVLMDYLMPSSNGILEKKIFINNSEIVSIVDPSLVLWYIVLINQLMRVQIWSLQMILHSVKYTVLLNYNIQSCDIWKNNFKHSSVLFLTLCHKGIFLYIAYIVLISIEQCNSRRFFSEQGGKNTVFFPISSFSVLQIAILFHRL